MKLRGTGIFPKITHGKAFLLVIETLESLREKALKLNLKLEDLEKAIEASKRKLESLMESLEEAENLTEIIEFQLMLLEDDSFAGEMLRRAREGVHPAEAVYQVVREVCERFSKSKSLYMRQRVADISDLGIRILRELLQEEEKEVPKGVIVVAHELTPTYVVRLSRTVKGIVTQGGSALSHFAIIARELEIPTVVGVKGIMTAVSDGDVLVLNGITGEVIVRPSEEELSKYAAFAEAWDKKLREVLKKAKEEARTKDGVKIRVVANIGKEDEVYLARNNGAEGVGLFRTEFYFLYKDSPPSEEEQYEIYKFVAEQMAPHDVFIRTLDIGSDKELPYLKLPKEPNPALGMRAVRIYDTELKELVEVQLRAILRAARHGSVGIMIPMIADVSEVLKMREKIKKIAEELGLKANDYKFGVMIETPAAALMAGKIMELVDFVSIGTNDLTQYTLAIDRAGKAFPEFFDHLHPAVLKLIKAVADESKKKGVEVSVCGESASDVLAIPVLIGLGITKLSVPPALVPLVKHIVRQLSVEELRELATKALDASEPWEVRELVRKYYAEKKLDIPIL